MNRDATEHTVTADDGSFNVLVLRQSSARFKAPSDPGTYVFHCLYHHAMSAKLHVQ